MRIKIKDNRYGDLKIDEMIGELAYVFNTANNMAMNEVPVKELYSYLEREGVEIELQ